MTSHGPVLSKVLSRASDNTHGLSSEEMKVPKYELIIYWSAEDEALIAEVPELPGCMADGQTYEEVVARVQVVIDEWIATAKELGRPIPEPKGRLIYA